MSDTPKTDAAAKSGTDACEFSFVRDYVDAELARELERENAAMRAFVEMVALDRDDRASPGLKRQATLMLQDLEADNFNPNKPC